MSEFFRKTLVSLIEGGKYTAEPCVYEGDNERVVNKNGGRYRINEKIERRKADDPFFQGPCDRFCACYPYPESSERSRADSNSNNIDIAQ